MLVRSFLQRGAGLLACPALFFLLATPLRSHDPITTKLTWTQEISRIVYKRCDGCHHEGGSAMSLTSYADARPWAKAIRDEVLSRRMPPWGAVKGIGEFVGDPSLSQQEIDMLVSWVEGGAPEGDLKLQPAQMPEFRTAATRTPRYARTLTVAGETTLSRSASLIAIRPKDLGDRGSLEAWATKPDGSVERLIWLTDYRKVWTRDYVLASPLRLPAGTKLHVAAKDAAAVFLLGS